jgi:hypothetical protein
MSAVAVAAAVARVKPSSETPTRSRRVKFWQSSSEPVARVLCRDGLARLSVALLDRQQRLRPSRLLWLAAPVALVVVLCRPMPSAAVGLVVLVD